MRKKVVYALTGLLAAVAVLSGCGGEGGGVKQRMLQQKPRKKMRE